MTNVPPSTFTAPATVLVTGGAGFIGNALALALFERGYHVVILDSLNSYYDPELKAARLARLPKDITVVRADLGDVAALKQLFTTHQFAAVCHLAAQAGVRYSLECPQVYVQSNYVGTFHLLEAMRAHGVRNVVFASTSSVYGTSTQLPFREDDLAPMPMSIYAATKRAGEHLIASYAHLFGIEATCLRFFTVYGPWSRPDMAGILFAKRLLAGEPIDVYNHGNMRRDFTYIDDIVDGFVRALERPNGYRIFNVGAGQPVGLRAYIAALERALGVTAQLNLLPLQPGDVPETAADISAARAALGYEPRTALDDGVAAFAAWYREYYRAP